MYRVRRFPGYQALWRRLFCGSVEIKARRFVHSSLSPTDVVRLYYYIVVVHGNPNEF